jgi:hypothetical protein
LVATGDALGQIVIEDTPISDLDLVTTVSLYGYREITPSMLAYAGKKSTRAFYFSSWDELNEREREIKSGELRVGISERVIAAAFSSDFRFEKFRETREGQNPVDVSFPIIAWGLANIQKQEKPELVKQKLIFQDLPVGGDAKAKAVYDSALMVNLASVGFYGNAATKENMLDWYIGTTNTKVRLSTTWLQSIRRLKMPRNCLLDTRPRPLVRRICSQRAFRLCQIKPDIGLAK